MTKEEAIEYIKSYPDGYFEKARRAGYICPLCQNGTGSSGTGLEENPNNKGHYKCFKCDESGDVLHFIGKEYGLNNFPEILDKAFSIYGIIVEDNNYTANRSKKKMDEKIEEKKKPNAASSQEQDKTDYTEFYKKANKELNDDYEKNNKMNYLMQRGISIETQNKFNIGYDKEWKSPKALKEGSNPPASPRVIIPTSACSYVARDVRPDVKDYKVLKEGQVHLFNSKALQEDSCEPIFIAEGEIDALSIIEAGSQAIALGSVANGNLLIKELEKVGEAAKKRTYVICLDNDKAGKDASKKLEEQLSQFGYFFMNKSAEILADCKDANEALVKDKDKFITAIAEIKSDAAELIEKEREDYIQKRRDKIKRVITRIYEGWKTIPTGFTELDSFLDGGFHTGLYILAANSGVGKTTFALQIADCMAKNKQHVLFFSGEMSVDEMIAKRLSRMSKETAGSIDRNAMTMRTIMNVKETNNSDYIKRIDDILKCSNGKMNEEERVKAIKETLPENEHAAAIASDDMYRYGDMTQYIDVIDELRDINTINTEVKNHKKIMGKSPVVFIDYLQIMKNADSMLKDKRLQIDEIISELRIMAAKHRIPVVVISALNRGGYSTKVSSDEADKKRNKEPSEKFAEKFIEMSDLKESGGIEYGADVILTLNVKGRKAASKDNIQTTKLQVIKNRTGNKHIETQDYIGFNFHARFNYFEEIEKIVINSNTNKIPADNTGKKENYHITKEVFEEENHRAGK
jgi:replicative DNA helicase